MAFSADGRGSVTNLTNSTTADENSPSWSPTGDRLAFDRLPTGGGLSDGDLYVMAANGANPTLLYDGDATHVATDGTAWSPDGTKILFSLLDNGSSDMFTIPVGGGSTTQVPGDGYQNSLLAWGPLASFELSVTSSGSGSGTVTSSPAGISCGTCSATFVDPTTVTLTPTAAQGSTFAGWTGDCSGTDPCVVLMSGDHAVTARFDPAGGSGGGGGGGAAPPPPAPAPVTPVTTPSTSTTPAALVRSEVGVRRTGSAKSDTLRGTARNDVLIGLAGNERLYGGAGHDVLKGGRGNDLLYGGAGADTIFGGPGNDVVYAKDGTKDSIDCGTGHDVVFADRIDSVAHNCEVVHRG
jgi:Ca2+-binding RTX toxin-like protein